VSSAALRAAAWGEGTRGNQTEGQTTDTSW
jgi:hypothetical protein